MAPTKSARSNTLTKNSSLQNRIKDLFNAVTIPDYRDHEAQTGSHFVDARPVEFEPQVLAEPGSLISEENGGDVSVTVEVPENFNEVEKRTIENLSMHRFRIEPDKDASHVEQAFRGAPDLVGIIVQDQSQVYGVISRRKFYELLGKTYGVSIFMRRPISVLLESLPSQVLTVPAASLITEVVSKALDRTTDQIYEPVLVIFSPTDCYLLDIYTLLLAQTDMLRNLRQQMKQVNEELEVRVRVRTAALQQEIGVRRRAETMLNERLRYEATLNLCAKVLLTGANSDENIMETMRLLLDLVASSRVFILEYSDKVEGIGPGLKLTHQLSAPQIPPISGELNFFPHAVWGEWFKTLWEGKPLIGRVSSSGSRANRMLREIEIVSLLLIPIGEPGNWFGAVGFGEIAINRDWDMNEIGLLTTIAQMFSSYFKSSRSALALAAARDEALRASEFKSELLAKVSHELRTPLGAILGYAQLLSMGSYGDLTEEQKGATDVVISSTRYLSTLVNGILDQAQLESGQLTLLHQLFNIRKMAEDVESRIRVLAESKDLQFEVAFEAEIPQEMVGDRMRLEQVLINLLGNAVKFTDRGKIAMRFRKLGSNTLAIEVADTGAGIPAEAQSKIFEPFMQVDGSPTRRYSGTGLGLSISRQLVAMMNGQIRLVSQAGLGSVFIVELPIHAKIPAGNKNQQVKSDE